MIQVKCIQKFRDKNNQIIGYRLQDTNGNTKDIDSQSLKQSIISHKIDVTNLKLTSDNRLIDKDDADKEVSKPSLRQALFGECPTPAPVATAVAETEDNNESETRPSLQQMLFGDNIDPKPVAAESSYIKSGAHNLIYYVKKYIANDIIDQLDSDALNKSLITGENIYNFIQKLGKIHIPDIFIYNKKLFIKYKIPSNGGYVVIKMRDGDMPGSIRNNGDILAINVGKESYIEEQYIGLSLMSTNGCIVGASNISDLGGDNIFTLKFESEYGKLYANYQYYYGEIRNYDYSGELITTHELVDITNALNDNIIKFIEKLHAIVGAETQLNKKAMKKNWNIIGEYATMILYYH